MNIRIGGSYGYAYEEIVKTKAEPTRLKSDNTPFFLRDEFKPNIPAKKVEVDIVREEPIKEIPKQEFHKYGYITSSDWGTNTVHNLDVEKRYYCCVTDKNRFGRKSKLLFEVDLDLNTWYEIGELVRK